MHLQPNDCNFKTKLHVAYREMTTQKVWYLDVYGSFHPSWEEKQSWCWIWVGTILMLCQTPSG